MSLDIDLEGVKTEVVRFYEGNITHNLTKMADEAGLYEALWRPYKLKSNYTIFENKDLEYQFEKDNPVFAKEIIEKLVLGLLKLKSEPEYFKKFNPENGWGTYEGLVTFVENYLKACGENPEAIIKISR